MSKKDSKEDTKNKKISEKTINEMEERIQILEAEKQELFEKLQRLSADYQNFQKRSPKQIADSVAYEKKAIIRSLLPSLDNFEHALSHADTAQGPEAIDNMIKGIRLVFDHMLDALKAHGISKIESLGKPFNPNFHEAMMQRVEPDKDDQIVLEEFQAGYMLNDQVLRPARVIVNKLPESPQPEDEQQPDEQADSNQPEKSKVKKIEINVDSSEETESKNDPENSESAE